MTHDSIGPDRAGGQVGRYWWRAARRGEAGFWLVPGWDEHQKLLASSSGDRTWLDVFADEFASPQLAGGLALSLGSGGGAYERTLLDRGIASRVEACDISPQLVRLAQERADADGEPIRYFVADLNTPALAPRHYDLVLAAAVFHHIENLEGLFESLAGTLKPGGYLLVYDYVGPNRFQWRKAQVAACEAWLRRLPESYRRKRGYPWHYVAAKRAFDTLPFVRSDRSDAALRHRLPPRAFAQYSRLKGARLTLDEIISPPVEQFLVTDPSEAVRSEDILGLLPRYFDVVRVVPLGGTIAQPLFSRIAPNFARDQEGRDWAARILSDERELVRSGALPSDFVAVYATPRDPEAPSGPRRVDGGVIPSRRPPRSG